MSDFERYFKDGKYILGTSLAEKVLISCCKMIEEKKYSDLVDYFLFHLDNVIQHFPDNIWLKYHKGKLLLFADRGDDAKEFIIPVVREKQSESWAWGLLGNIFIKEDIEKSIACLSKGILVCQEENFITNIRLDLAKVLIEKKLLPEAKCEIESVVNFKKLKGQKLSDDIHNYLNEEWFKSAQSIVNNNELYENYIDLANSILLETLPWLKATITGKDMKSERAFILLEDNNNASVKFKLNKIIGDLGEGAPVIVKAGNEIGKVTIYALENRDGDYWDLIPSEIGIIDDINESKQLSHIILDKNKDCIAHYDKFSKIKDYPIGSFVKCKTKSIKKDFITKIILLTCEKTEEKPSENIYKTFSGYFVDPEKRKSLKDFQYNDYEDEVEENNKSITVCNTFGFIETSETSQNIYVHKSLVQKNKLKQDDNVNCEVVFSVDKKGKSGWRAISIEKMIKQ